MTICHVCNKKMGPLATRGKCSHCKRWICKKCMIKKTDGRYCPRCDVKL